MMNRNRKRKLLIIITICSTLLVLFGIYCCLFGYLDYLRPVTPYFYYTQLPFNANKTNLKDSEPSINATVDQKNSKQKIIVLWTNFFGVPNYIQSVYDTQSCLFNNCMFTSNRSYLRESDALIFHLRDIDYKDWPQYRRPDQRYIFLNHESPQNSFSKFSASPDKLNGLFNWTATYRSESDIFLSPVIRRRSQPNLKYDSDIDFSANKTRMIVWLVSNCAAHSNRERYVEELKKTVTVDVYGKCGDKRCLPKMSSRCLEKLSKEYRFILAFENSICRDYVTEKYFDSIGYDIIPVVFGGSDYDKFAPKKSLINALSYKSPRHLARYLLFLSKNPNNYNEYFKWKKDYELYAQHYTCQICRKLNDPMEPVKVWNNLKTWWYNESHCTTWKPNKYFH